jgi:Holliday junction resolvase RusA-like endonuclease
MSLIPSEGVRWYQFHVNPEPWAVGPLVVGRRNGKYTANMGRNQQLDAYKSAIREDLERNYPASQSAILPPYYSLDMFFWRQQEHYRNAHERNIQKHEADVTNLQKATEDALQGILIGNDRDVVRICSYCVEQGPDVTPGVVIRIRWGIPKGEHMDILPNHIRDELLSYRHLSLAQPAPEQASNAWPPEGELQEKP